MGRGIIFCNLQPFIHHSSTCKGFNSLMDLFQIIHRPITLNLSPYTLPYGKTPLKIRSCIATLTWFVPHIPELLSINLTPFHCSFVLFWLYHTLRICPDWSDWPLDVDSAYWIQVKSWTGCTVQSWKLIKIVWTTAFNIWNQSDQ